jgi:hypothetical protein
MKYIIYELFTGYEGVGFCNQLFSLETAIYLANISNRKLILLIKRPLAHCGKALWEYGKVLDFFSEDYIRYLPMGIEVYYDKVPSHIQNIMNHLTINIQKHFSTTVFVDHNIPLTDTSLNIFLGGRSPYVFNISEWTTEYVGVFGSNASRCFTNFYTTKHNYQIMSNICASLTKLHPNFYKLYKTLKLPVKYMSIHIRMGDTEHAKSVINKTIYNPQYKWMYKLLQKYNPSHVVIMADRWDCDITKSLLKNQKVTSSEEYINSIDISEYFKQKNTLIIEFIVQKLICEKSNIFIGQQGSTVSNHIQYNNHLVNKPFIHYLHRPINHVDNKCTWKINNIKGSNISWRQFFKDNVYKPT